MATEAQQKQIFIRGPTVVEDAFQHSLETLLGYLETEGIVRKELKIEKKATEVAYLASAQPSMQIFFTTAVGYLFNQIINLNSKDLQKELGVAVIDHVSEIEDEDWQLAGITSGDILCGMPEDKRAKARGRIEQLNVNYNGQLYALEVGSLYEIQKLCAKSSREKVWDYVFSSYLNGEILDLIEKFESVQKETSGEEQAFITACLKYATTVKKAQEAKKFPYETLAFLIDHREILEKSIKTSGDILLTYKTLSQQLRDVCGSGPAKAAIKICKNGKAGEDGEKAELYLGYKNHFVKTEMNAGLARALCLLFDYSALDSPSGAQGWEQLSL